MGEMIYWELDYVCSCILWGLFLMLIYDMLRIERRVWKRGSIWVSIEDILYWSFAAIGTFRLFYQQDNGVIRWFAIAATFLMMLLMNRFISRWTVPLISRILRIPIRFLEKVIKKVIGFFRKIGKMCKRRLQSGKEKATIRRKAKQEKQQRKREEQQREQKEQKRKQQESKRKQAEQQRKQRERQSNSKAEKKRNQGKRGGRHGKKAKEKKEQQDRDFAD